MWEVSSTEKNHTFHRNENRSLLKLGSNSIPDPYELGNRISGHSFTEKQWGE